VFVPEQSIVVVVIKVGTGSKMAPTASGHLDWTVVGRYLGPLAKNKNMLASKADRYANIERTMNYYQKKERTMNSQLEASL